MGRIATNNMSRTSIHKAVIPVAGLGTRLRPLSAVVPKAMMPLPVCTDSTRQDGAMAVLPVLHHILAEAAAAGVREAAVVVSPGQEEMLQRYLDAARKTHGKGLPARVEFLVQEEALGFGHAVWLAKDFAGGGPVMVLLGDHVYAGKSGRPGCAAQVARAFADLGGAAMIGVQPVGEAGLSLVGVAGGVPLGGGVYRCTDFIEKPDLATARRRLRTGGLPAGRFLAHAGVYVFAAEIFDCIEELLSARRRSGAEVQLADAQSILLTRHPEDYYLMKISGQAYDTGTPAGYAATWKAFLRRA